MKQMYRIGLFVVVTLFFGSMVSAQAFSGKGLKSIQIGLGLSEHHGWYPENGKGPKGHVSPLAGNINVQLEFGIGKYVGLGGSIGFDYASNLSRNSVGFGYYGSPLLGNSYGSSSFRSFAVPITLTADFHFFQLIQDKSGKSLHADKLDIYAGLDFGSGPAFAVPKSAYKSYGSDVGYMIYGGPHVGIKYYVNEKMGVFLEIGYGKAYLNGGVNFKF
jgi:hypothetical protein